MPATRTGSDPAPRREPPQTPANLRFPRVRGVSSRITRPAGAVTRPAQQTVRVRYPGSGGPRTGTARTDLDEPAGKAENALAGRGSEAEGIPDRAADVIKDKTDLPDGALDEAVGKTKGFIDERKG